MKNAIELIRVSTEMQAADDRASIPAQRHINRRTAAQFGLEIVRSIEMADVSGAAVLHAPEIQEMLRLIESPDIHAIITKEFTRLMRPENLADFAMLQAFIDSNTVLYLPDGPIDFRSESGFLLGGLRALMAGVERKQILGRVWDAKEEKRRRGENPQSSICLPHGVAWTRERGWEYTDDAEAVCEAFRRFLSGEHNYAKLAQLVGVTPRGMHLILRNPIYSGWRVIDKKRDLSPKGKMLSPNGRQGDRRKVQRAAEDIIRLKVFSSPLISETDFALVQRIMDARQRQHWRSDSEYEHRFLYAGFLKCAECGDRLYTHFRRDDYYICKSRRRTGGCSTVYMRRDRIEPTLDSLISGRLTDESFLANIHAEWLKASAAEPRSPERTRARIASLDRKRQRVIDAFCSGYIGKNECDTRMAAIDAERTAATREMLSSSAAVPDVESLAAIFEPFKSWKFLKFAQKRQLLAAVIPQIRVANYRVTGVEICRTDESRRDTDSSRPPA
ncbi:MAG: recombinase family protein [Terriglobales bacterium]